MGDVQQAVHLFVPMQEKPEAQCSATLFRTENKKACKLNVLQAFSFF